MVTIVATVVIHELQIEGREEHLQNKKREMNDLEDERKRETKE